MENLSKDWCSTIGDDGYGPMYADDYKVLMESHGFRVIVAKPYPISYKVTEVISGRCSPIFLPHFPRNLLLKEDKKPYLARLQN